MIRYYRSIVPLFRLLRLRCIVAVWLVTLLGLPTLTLAQATSQTVNANGIYVVPAGYTALVPTQLPLGLAARRPILPPTEEAHFHRAQPW